MHVLFRRLNDPPCARVEIGPDGRARIAWAVSPRFEWILAETLLQRPGSPGRYPGPVEAFIAQPGTKGHPEDWIWFNDPDGEAVLRALPWTFRPGQGVHATLIES